MRLSSLTEYERICIVAQYNSFFKSNGMDPRLLERGYSDEQLKHIRNTMGTNTITSCGIRFDCDISELNHPSFNFLYTCYNAWDKHNQLPYSGSFVEQPCKIIESFSIFDQLKYEQELKSRHEAQKKAKRK